MRTAITILSLCLLSCVTGCSSADEPTPVPPPDTQSGLKELGEVYKYIATQKGRYPTKPSDLDEYSGALPSAHPLVNDGTIVVNWGVRYSANGKQVLAYEKDAKSKGGQVLLQNGEVRLMKPAELN